MEFFGQDRLVTHFNSFNINTLPHAVLLVGDAGSGRHTLCTYLSNRLNLNKILIEEKVTASTIEMINDVKIPSICIIPGEKITLGEESILLKFIEEPNPNIFVFILSDNINYILPTIRTRCEVYTLDKYNADNLNRFYFETLKSAPDILNFPTIFKILNTPGKILRWGNLNISEMEKYANDIFNLISKATLANILNIPKKIDFSGNTKFPVNLFIDILYNVAYNRVVEKKDDFYSQFQLTRQLKIDLTIPNINKQRLFEHYLYELKGCYNMIQ